MSIWAIVSLLVCIGFVVILSLLDVEDLHHTAQQYAEDREQGKGMFERKPTRRERRKQERAANTSIKNTSSKNTK